MKLFLILVCVPLALMAEIIPDMHWFRNQDLQKLLDQKTSSRSYYNNKVRLLKNGDLTFTQMMSNFSRADVILIKTLEFYDDESSNLLIDLLIERAKSGAKVFIQYDVKGVFALTRPNSDYAIKIGKINAVPENLQRFVDQANGNGFLIPCSFPNSITAIYNYDWVPKDHEKYFISWENRDQVSPVKVIMGGMNIGDMYFFGGAKGLDGNYKTVPFYSSLGGTGSQILGMRDTDIEVIGTVNKEIIDRYVEAAEDQLQNTNEHFQNQFSSSIQLAIKELKKIQDEMSIKSKDAFPENIGDAFVRFIFKKSVQFGSETAHNFSNMFKILLKHVPKKSVVKFTSGFFVPTKKVWKAMVDAAYRGVTLDVLVNLTQSPEESMGLIALTSRKDINYFIRTMPHNSINFYEWLGDPSRGEGTVLHQKVYSFGVGEYEPCCIGSVNLDSMALYWDSEGALLIQCPELKREVDEMLASDFSYPNARKITKEDFENQPFWEKMKGFFLRKIFRDFL